MAAGQRQASNKVRGQGPTAQPYGSLHLLKPNKPNNTKRQQSGHAQTLTTDIPSPRPQFQTSIPAAAHLIVVGSRQVGHQRALASQDAGGAGPGGGAPIHHVPRLQQPIECRSMQQFEGGKHGGR